MTFETTNNTGRSMLEHMFVLAHAGDAAHVEDLRQASWRFEAKATSQQKRAGRTAPWRERVCA